MQVMICSEEIMIELLSSAKVSPFETRKNNISNNKVEKQFKNQLDDSLSQQKALKEEIQQYKLSDQKKELKELAEKIQELKKTLKLEEEPNEKTHELIASLEQIFSFLQNTVQSMEEGKISQESELVSWVTDMTNFLSQATEKLDSRENLSILHKVAFILEGVDLEEIDFSMNAANYQHSQQIKVVLENISQEFQTIMDSQNTQSISIDKEQVLVDNTLQQNINADYENVDMNETGDIQLSEEFEIIEDGEETVAMENFSGEFESDSESGDTSEHVKITDLRTKKSIDNNTNIDSPFTLEQIDTTAKATDVQVDNKIIAQPLKSEMIAAERLYSSFSSAVSRVQVEALMQNVSGKISMILQDGGNELRMKLTPPELGQMKLSFLSEDGMMRGKIVVETPEAKLFFEQNINNLRESLANVGISLGSVDVELGNHQDFSSSETEEPNNIQAIRSTESSEGISREVALVSPDVIVDFTA